MVGDARALWNRDLHGCAGWAGPAVGSYVRGAIAQASRCWHGVVSGGRRGRWAGDTYPTICSLVLPLDDEAEACGRRLELQRDVRVWSGGVLGGGRGGRGHLRGADADGDRGRGIAAV